MKIINPILIKRRPTVRRSMQGYRHVGDRNIYFRSNWEYRYALYLQFLKEQGVIQEWEHEPKTFWFELIKRGVRSYLPDFKIIKDDGTHYWVEVKGYMDSKSKTKLKRFKKYYPEEQLFLADESWFKKYKHLLHV